MEQYGYPSIKTQKHMKVIETNLNELSKEQHERMVEKGFYDGSKQIGTLLMLTVSELSEAL